MIRSILSKFSRSKTTIKKEPYEGVTDFYYNRVISDLEGSKYCEVSEDEEHFIRYLLYKLHLNKEKGYVQLKRMSNKTIDFHYKGFPVGKIKLHGRSTSMQILINLYDHRNLKDIALNEYINEIDSWVKYIKKVKHL